MPTNLTSVKQNVTIPSQLFNEILERLEVNAAGDAGISLLLNKLQSKGLYKVLSKQ